jgi:hypothetical protein
MKNPRNEEDYTIEEEAKNNQQSGEESILAKLLHIAKIAQHPTFENLPEDLPKDLPTYKLKNDQHYYVNTP